jgi:hypothetical protein
MHVLHWQVSAPEHTVPDVQHAWPLPPQTLGAGEPLPQPVIESNAQATSPEHNGLATEAEIRKVPPSTRRTPGGR